MVYCAVFYPENPQRNCVEVEKRREFSTTEKCSRLLRVKSASFVSRFRAVVRGLLCAVLDAIGFPLFSGAVR